MSELVELLMTSDIGRQIMLAGGVLLAALMLQALFFAVLRSCDDDGFHSSRLVPSFCQALRFPLGTRGQDGDLGDDGD